MKKKSYIKNKLDVSATLDRTHTQCIYECTDGEELRNRWFSDHHGVTIVALCIHSFKGSAGTCGSGGCVFSSGSESKNR